MAKKVIQSAQTYAESPVLNEVFWLPHPTRGGTEIFVSVVLDRPSKLNIVVEELETSLEDHENYCHEHGGHLRDSPACYLARERTP